MGMQERAELIRAWLTIDSAPARHRACASKSRLTILPPSQAGAHSRISRNAYAGPRVRRAQAALRSGMVNSRSR
jgi:hypothetical protein